MSRINYKNVLSLGFVFEVLNRDLKLIFLANLVGSFGDGLYFYILPLYIRELGAEPAEVGMLFSVMCLTAALTPVLGGFIADKYDRKKAMILAWLLWLPVPVILSLAENWGQLVPGMILYGSWIGQPASSAYIATSAHKDKMTLTFTTLSAAWSLGYIFSPTLGGYFSTVIGMRWVFWTAFVFYALCTVILFFISSQHAATKPSQHPSTSVVFNKKKILVWSAFFAVMIFFIVLVRPCIPQFLDDVFKLSEFHVGILGSVTFLGSAVLAVCLGRIGDKWKKASAVSVSMVLCCVSIGILVSFNNFLTLTLSSFLMGASYAIWSLMGAVVGSMAPEASRGRWMSVSQTTCMLATVFAPYLGGVLYEASPYNPFIVTVMATPLLSILALSKLLEEN